MNKKKFEKIKQLAFHVEILNFYGNLYFHNIFPFTLRFNLPIVLVLPMYMQGQ